MRTYKLLLAYDGTRYSGWQIQPNATSIQEIVENAIKKIVRHDVRVIGSGRTDAGVHALEQPAHFKSPIELDLFRFKGSMNGILPQDIRVLDARVVPDDFHAQYSAKGKIYHYHLYLDKVMNPFRRLYCWHVHASVDLQLLKAAKQYFVGKHDFSAVSNETHRGSAAKNPVRTLKRIDLVQEEGGIRFEFEGDGFLYKMVRNIVGTCVEVAIGQRELHSLPKMLESKDRRQAGQAAPPQGLFLVKVDYS